MANTTIATANRVKQWDAKFFKEYIRSNRFRRYMGTSPNAIIQTVENLTKNRGDQITIPLVGALDKSGGYNDGSTDLVGNEKALPNDGMPIQIGVVRDATVVNMEEEQASPIDIRNAGRTALKDLNMRYLRDDLITALGSINGTAYGSASETNKDAWLVDNADRVLFGALNSNNSSNDHSASLANIDTTNDKLTKEIVSLMKRLAQSATTANGDGIRPYKYGEDEETYVMFAGTLAYRDLKLDLATAHQDARERAKTNPLFTGTTSLYWDGVVIREIPELPVYSGVGAASSNVEPVYLCGSQALGVAWATRTKTTLRKEDDYGFQHGVGFYENRGIEKIRYGAGGSDSVDWGMVTGYVSSVADA